MRILRSNRDSVEAVLEAFVRDPLIQHLVLNPREIDPRSGRPAERAIPIAEHRYSKTQQGDGGKAMKQLSPKAQKAIARAKAKLEGKEFGTPEPLAVPEQVARLIIQATESYVLASAYQGEGIRSALN
jgi:FKBP12-rapamycin complex-associated protein